LTLKRWGLIRLLWWLLTIPLFGCWTLI